MFNISNMKKLLKNPKLLVKVPRKLAGFVLRKIKKPVPVALESIEELVVEEQQPLVLENRVPNNPLLIAVVSPEPVYSKMAGPALRAFHIATELAKHFDVVLFHQQNDDLNPSTVFIERHCNNFELVAYTTLDFRDIEIEKFDYFLSPTLGLDAIDKLVKSSVKIIYDFYNVLPIENLFTSNSSETEAKIKKTYWDMIRQMHLLSLSGSHYLVSHDKQRDYWLGFLSATRRLDPKWCSIVDHKKLFSTLPFGIESNLPEKTENVIRGRYKNIDEETVLLVWSGGVWNWFDAQTAIRGIAKLNKNSSKKYVLFFYGVKHPNPAQSQLSELNATIELAKELSLYEEFVHFNFDWVDFDKRYNYLLEADILISLHKNNLETDFSFRTRILDHLWVKKPTIATVGDYFANVISENDIGKTVDYGNVDEFVESVIAVSSKKQSNEFVKRIEKVRTQFLWENTTKELIAKIKNDEIKPEIDPEFTLFRTLCKIED
jgi:glycosyltransferase involved in cell wall biosynthesis